MSAILAVYHRNRSPIAPDLLEHMLAEQPAHAVDGQDVWRDGAVALGHQHFWVMPEEQGERQPLALEAVGLVIAADVRLDNRAELAHALGIEAAAVPTLSDAHLIALAYQRWNVVCVEHLLGDFAFAVWDQQRQQIFLARDPLGTRGLSYFVNRDVLVAGTEIAHLLGHPAVQPRINETRLVQFLNFKFDEREQTYYQDIFYLPPAHCLLVTADSLQKWRYWELDLEQRVRYTSDQEYGEHLHELLAQAVRDRLRGTGGAGISLSGGLDSSSLAALLAAEAGPDRRPLRSFSNVFDELPSCDERQYIQQTVDTFGYQATFIPSDGFWTLRDAKHWPVLRDLVAFDPYPRLPQAVIQAASDAGCRLLFGGYYGDMLFTGSRFWLQSLLSTGRITEVAQLLGSTPTDINWRRLLVHDGLYRYTPAWAKQMGKRWAADSVRSHPAIHSDLIRRAGVAHANGSDREHLSGSRPAVARRRSFDVPVFGQGFAAARHRYAANGIELALPYWDRRIVEFAMAVPADQLGLPGQDRRVLRNAMRPYLPKPVAQRPPRTEFTALMRRGLLERETETIRALLAAPRIVEEGYVRREWLDRAYAELPAWNEDLTTFWCCLCLELWLQAYW